MRRYCLSGRGFKDMANACLGMICGARDAVSYGTKIGVISASRRLPGEVDCMRAECLPQPYS